MKKVRITRKFQVTIPREIVNSVGLKMGDVLKVSESGGKIVMEKVDEVEELAGILRPHGRKVLGLAEELDRDRKDGSRD